MLDVQRNRGAKHLKEINFTRKIMWSHMIVGAVVITLFLFHEVFNWFAGSIVWYALSLAAMYGFMSERSCCRWLLALVFLGGAAAGLFFISQVFPVTLEPRVQFLPRSFMPFWVGLANLVYGVGTMVLLFDSRIRRAGEAGFTLW